MKCNIARFCSPNWVQKVGNTAENCKWHNFSPDLGVTPGILFSLFKIFYREFCFFCKLESKIGNHTLVRD